jgi:general secretion pathway protein D
VRSEELGGVLESILESNGLVLVRNGPVAQVMPTDKAPATGPISYGRELPSPPPLGLVTQIVPLQTVRAEEGVEMLQKLAGPKARIETVPRSNAVLITDRGVHVARYLELLRQLDTRSVGEAGLRTYVYPLKHAQAADLATTLGQLYGVSTSVPAGATTPERTGALEERSLSRTLQRFEQREAQALEQRREQPIPTLQPPPQPTDTTGRAPGAPTRGLVGQTTIVADPATNSLVIRTAPPNFPVLRETIEALDVRPPQVLLEVLIAEVTLDRTTQYGIDWQAITTKDISGKPSETTAGFGPGQFGDTALTSASDAYLRVVRLGGVNVRAVLHWLSSRSDVRVLATPHVLALNNEEARILVGNEVPFSQSTRTGLDVVVDQTVQYRNVGTQLTITPTINTDGYVTFKILQEASSLTNVTIPAALNAPVISTREAETSAIVKGGQTIVIGGLIQDQRSKIVSGVPVLKDLPLLGLLFRRQQNARTRTELAIFVTPHVVFSDEDAARLLEQERERLRRETGTRVEPKFKDVPPKPE